MAILSIKNVKEENKELVGKRAVSLSRIAQEMPVPMGFVITKDVFNFFMQNTGIMNKINNLSRVIDVSDDEKIQGIANEIQKMIVRAEMPQEMKDAIIEAYHSLNIDEESSLKEIIASSTEPLVDVKTSSVTGEEDDIMIRHVAGKDKIIEAVLSCYALHYSARSFAMRVSRNVDDKGMGIIVQRSLNPDVSGTAYIEEGEAGNFIEIKAVFGLKTEATQNFADVYLLDHDTLQLIDVSPQKQPYDIRKDIGTKRVAKEDLSDDVATRSKIPDDDIAEIAKNVKAALDHVDRGKAIEFAIEKGKFFITSIQKKEEQVDSFEKAQQDSDEDGDELYADAEEDINAKEAGLMHEGYGDDAAAGYNDKRPDDGQNSSNDVMDFVLAGGDVDEEKRDAGKLDGDDDEDKSIFSAFKSKQSSEDEAQGQEEEEDSIVISEDAFDEKDSLLGARNALGHAIVECDLGLYRRLRDSYQQMFNDYSELDFEELLEIVAKETEIADKDRLLRVHELRNRFVDYGRTPTIIEVKFAFETAKDFLESFKN